MGRKPGILKGSESRIKFRELMEVVLQKAGFEKSFDQFSIKDLRDLSEIIRKGGDEDQITPAALRDCKYKYSGRMEFSISVRMIDILSRYAGFNSYFEFSSKFENQESIESIDASRDRSGRIKVFISHSHKDILIAQAIIDLLQGALNLENSNIRCTSVDGYRLRAGTSTDSQLKAEIYDADILLGLISPASISSHYVLFELGARWGANKPLIPIVTDQKGMTLLKGPLQGINALESYREPQVIQLVEDVGYILKMALKEISTFQMLVSRLVTTSLNSGENPPHTPL